MAFLYFYMSFMVWTMLGLPSTEIGGIKSLYFFYSMVALLVALTATVTFLIFVVIIGLSLVKTRWRTTWGVQSGCRIKVSF